MKKLLHPICILLIIWAGSASTTKAQYCTPPAYLTGPYTGITKVEFGSLNNTSSDADGYTDYTGSVAAPTVNKGQTYTLNVDLWHTLIGTFSGQLNVRVWIDWNGDGDFNDNGEEVLNADGIQCQTPGPTGGATATANVTIPAGAITGTTRMRVYEDMLVNEGHDPPNPCGYSTGIGQHGECEDYNITIATGTSVTELKEGTFDGLVTDYANNRILVNYELNTNTNVDIQVVDVQGKVVQNIINKTQNDGKYTQVIDLSSISSKGVYLVVMRTNSGLVSRKIVK